MGRNWIIMGENSGANFCGLPRQKRFIASCIEIPTRPSKGAKPIANDTNPPAFFQRSGTRRFRSAFLSRRLRLGSLRKFLILRIFIHCSCRPKSATPSTLPPRNPPTKKPPPPTHKPTRPIAPWEGEGGSLALLYLPPRDRSVSIAKANPAHSHPPAPARAFLGSSISLYAFLEGRVHMGMETL